MLLRTFWIIPFFPVFYYWATFSDTWIVKDIELLKKLKLNDEMNVLNRQYPYLFGQTLKWRYDKLFHNSNFNSISKSNVNINVNKNGEENYNYNYVHNKYINCKSIQIHNWMHEKRFRLFGLIFQCLFESLPFMFAILLFMCHYYQDKQNQNTYTSSIDIDWNLIVFSFWISFASVFLNLLFVVYQIPNIYYKVTIFNIISTYSDLLSIMVIIVSNYVIYTNEKNNIWPQFYNTKFWICTFIPVSWVYLRWMFTILAEFNGLSTKLTIFVISLIILCIFAIFCEIVGLGLWFVFLFWHINERRFINKLKFKQSAAGVSPGRLPQAYSVLQVLTQNIEKKFWKYASELKINLMISNVNSNQTITIPDTRSIHFQAKGGNVKNINVQAVKRSRKEHNSHLLMRALSTSIDLENNDDAQWMSTTDIITQTRVSNASLDITKTMNVNLSGSSDDKNTRASSNDLDIDDDEIIYRSPTNNTASGSGNKGNWRKSKKSNNLRDDSHSTKSSRSRQSGRFRGLSAIDNTSEWKQNDPDPTKFDETWKSPFTYPSEPERLKILGNIQSLALTCQWSEIFAFLDCDHPKQAFVDELETNIRGKGDDDKKQENIKNINRQLLKRLMCINSILLQCSIIPTQNNKRFVEDIASNEYIEDIGLTWLFPIPKYSVEESNDMFVKFADFIIENRETNFENVKSMSQISQNANYISFYQQLIRFFIQWFLNDRKKKNSPMFWDLVAILFMMPLYMISRVINYFYPIILYFVLFSDDDINGWDSVFNVSYNLNLENIVFRKCFGPLFVIYLIGLIIWLVYLIVDVFPFERNVYYVAPGQYNINLRNYDQLSAAMVKMYWKSYVETIVINRFGPDIGPVLLLYLSL